MERLQKQNIKKVVKLVPEYIWKVLKKFWPTTLAFLPDISDFIANYIYPEFNFNLPKWILIAILTVGFFISTFLVWLDQINEKNALKKELEQLLDQKLEYKVSIKKKSFSTEIEKRIADIETELYQTEIKLREEFAIQMFLQQREVFYSSGYTNKLSDCLNELSEQLDKLQELQKADFIYFEIKNLTNNSDSSFRIELNVEKYKLQEFYEIEDLITGESQSDNIYNLVDPSVFHTKSDEEKEYIEDNKIILKHRSFRQKEVKTTNLYVFYNSLDNISYEIMSDKYNRKGLIYSQNN